MKALNGGPAFPINEEALMREMSGMTLRDYFAAKAMQAAISNAGIFYTDFSQISECAYAQADAMLEAQNK